MKRIRNEIINCLPSSSIWRYPTDGFETTAWDFGRASNVLPNVSKDSLPNCDLEPEWSKLRIFGHSDSDTWYFYLCVDPESGRIVGLDPEKYSELGERDVFDINTSIEQFIEIFLLLDSDLSSGNWPEKSKLDRIYAVENNRALAEWWLGWLDEMPDSTR